MEAKHNGSSKLCNGNTTPHPSARVLAEVAEVLRINTLIQVKYLDIDDLSKSTDPNLYSSKSEKYKFRNVHKSIFKRKKYLKVLI